MEKKMTISYVIGNKLYMNITNKCPCNCTFCIRNNGDGAYGSDSLWLEHDPSSDEIMNDIKKYNLSDYREIIFCGFGEPTCRLDVLVDTAKAIKNINGCPPLRLNTNGLSDLINNKSTSGILGEIFDTISISLNAGTEDEYMKVTRPKYNNAFEAMQKFASDCVKTNARVVMTVVDVIPEEQIKSAEEICRKTGAEFRVRTYDC
ncbi:MAG: TIGR04100 family radical SAM protein [Ruminococcus sp.]